MGYREPSLIAYCIHNPVHAGIVYRRENRLQAIFRAMERPAEGFFYLINNWLQITGSFDAFRNTPR